MSKFKLALIGYGGMGKQHIKRIENNKLYSKYLK